MTLEIETIQLSFVNCYLLKTASGFILIDTGLVNKRADLEKKLISAGCKAGDLKLIIITHGDPDHSGNGAYLRKKFGAKIAIHAGESEMVNRGDMLANRKIRQMLVAQIYTKATNLLFMLMKSDRFKADIFIDDGYDLSEWGFDATVLHIPGHSNGSIGVLTKTGELFCGDLIDNYGKPRLRFVDELDMARASIEKLGKHEIKIIYPGHGKPFSMEQYIYNNKVSN